MRYPLVAFFLLALGACAQPPTQVSSAPDLMKYIEPTGGASYSQSDLYYYTTNANPGHIGGPTIQRFK